MDNAISWLGRVLKSKNFWLKILFILIAALLWFLIKISKNGYVTTIDYPVMYENIPDQKLMIGKATEKIKIRISAYGFRLLGYSMKEVDPLRIDVKNQTRRAPGKKDVYYWLPSLYRPEIAAQLDPQTSLLRLEPDTVYLILSEKIKKEVPVVFNVETQFKEGFQSYSEAKSDPATVTISGPKIIVDTIRFVETKQKLITEIDADVREEVELDVNLNQISVDRTTVFFVLEVDQFTEKVLRVPVRLSNVPKGYKATIIPASIDVFCKIALRDADKLKPNDVDVVCDFRQLRQFPNREQLQLKVNPATSGFEILNTSQQSVKYLLFKK